jgi:outer membrane protein assembly factor BamA
MAMSLLVVLLPKGSAAMWPQNISKEKATECSTYSVRRIEFTGNAHTRDRYVRRKITLSEGKPLSERDIERTIKNLNRLRRLEELTRADITIAYGVEDPETPAWHCFADIHIHVKEKKR